MRKSCRFKARARAKDNAHALVIRRGAEWDIQAAKASSPRHRRHCSAPAPFGGLGRWCDFCGNDALVVGSDVALEVVALGKTPIAPVDWAYVRSVPRVRAKMRAQVEVEREALAAALETALERLLPGVHKLVAFQL